LLFVSGIGWLIGRYGLRQETQLGLLPHPSEVWWLRLHGAAVVVFLIVFGALFPYHVIHNWRRHLHRKSGLLLLIPVLVLALTGYGLYYLVSEQARVWVSVAHWVVGILAGGAFALHVVLSRRRAQMRAEKFERA
jgi:uncharacterized membrane protein AbrB (regulator of aidB expression)